MSDSFSPVFISYAHVDDQALGRDDEGWVTEFSRTLVRFLAREQGHDAFDYLPLWIDQRMRPGDGIDPVIEKAITEASVFVPIISSAYLKSQYCLRELEAFCKQDYQGRIVPILIGTGGVPVDLPVLKSALWGEFYTVDKLSGRNKLLSKPPHYNADDKYWNEMEAVAKNIWSIMQRHSQKRGDEMPLAQLTEDFSTAFPVYLAEVADDLLDQRDTLRDLLESGSKRKGAVLEPFPALSSLAPASDVVETCRAALARSGLSIHLFGAFRGRSLGNSGKPILHRELDEALASRPKFRPIVWMPPEVDLSKLSDKVHREAAEEVVRLANQGKVELIRSGFSKFYEEMERRLFPAPSPTWKKERAQSNLLVYVAYCGNSAAANKTIQDLKAHGCNGTSYLNHCKLENAAATPDATVRQLHDTNLMYCDGMVIVYEPKTLSWALKLAQQTWKAAGSGEGPRVIAAIEAEGTGAEFGFQTDSLYSVPPACLVDFVEKLRSSLNG